MISKAVGILSSAAAWRGYICEYTKNLYRADRNWPVYARHEKK